MDEDKQTRCGFVAMIGAPNAGKSTLVNRLVGAKVSIVTHKVQTTRAPLRGLAIRGPVQLVLVDTPGVFQPRRRLDRAMVRAAWTHADEADAIVHLVDAPAQALTAKGIADGADRASAEDVERIVERLKASGQRAILALNKVDAMPREALLSVTQAVFEAGVYDRVFMISAKRGDGVEDLAMHLAELAKPGPWHYPADQIADAPVRMLAAEITREKLMLRLHEELPYETTVETESFLERKDGSVRIEQTVFVTRESQRKITIGEGGQTLKAIGLAARLELQEILDRPVHLFVHVKVRESWAEERARFSALGLDYGA